MIFAHDYAVPAEAGGVWPQCDALRDLLRQLLVVTLINDPHRYRLEAYRWLSEILLLLTSRFQQPARMLSGTFLSAQQTHRPGDRANQCQLFPPYYACGNRRE